MFTLDDLIQKTKPVITSKSEATKHLEEFLSIKSDIEVGDYVERNKFGLTKLRMPSDNQVARVLAIYPRSKFDRNEQLYNGTIAVTHEDGDITTHHVDLRFYQKAKALKGKNVFSLKRGK